MGFDMNKQIPPRSKARAIAIPMVREDRLLFLIHAFLALLAPFLIFALTGCDLKIEGEPVDYGAVVPFSEISDAINEGVKDIDPSLTKKGAFVHYSTKQYLAAGKVVNVLSDTGLTVTERTEAAQGVELTLIEKRFTYGAPGEPMKEQAREFTLEFTNESASKAAPQTLQQSLQQSLQSLLSHEPGQSPGLSPSLSPVKATSEGARVTFHNLATGTVQLAAPKAVQAQPNCLGLPNCQVTLHNVSFDQVTWLTEGPQRIHFDFYVSPNVPQISGFNMSPVLPFYPGLYKSCITLMVSIGDGRSKTLLSECQEVENFRLESPPQP
jgi:hypothetical protein